MHGCKLRTRAGSVRKCEWKIVLENGNGMNWSVKQWMNEVNKRVSEVGLSKWRDECEVIYVALLKRSLIFQEIKHITLFLSL